MVFLSVWKADKKKLFPVKNVNSYPLCLQRLIQTVLNSQRMQNI